MYNKSLQSSSLQWKSITNTLNCNDIMDSFKGFQRSNWQIKPYVTPSRAGPLAITWLTACSAISECVWIKFLYHEDGTSEQTQYTPCQGLSDHHCSYTSLKDPNTYISAPAENKSRFPGLPAQPSKNFFPNYTSCCHVPCQETHLLIETMFGKCVWQHRALGGSVAVHCGGMGSGPGHPMYLWWIMLH